MKNLQTAALVLTVTACLCAACGGEDAEDAEDVGEGNLAVTLWGEDFIETGIPADEFADGYGITFDKFLVVLSDISVAEEGQSAALSAPEMKIWDVTQSGPMSVSSAPAPSGAYAHTAYRISPATASAISGNVGDDDVQMMISEGLSVYVEGTASDGTTDISFAWGFDTDTLYDPCHSTGSLTTDGKVSVQITIHGDHLFYDSAISENPELRFNDIALADLNGDGIVIEEELLAYSITALPNYLVGSLDIDNLYDYISHMTTTLGHIDGEGHCEVTEKAAK